MYPFVATCGLPTGEAFEGDCLDLGAGGACVRFPLAQDPGLAEGDAVVLLIEALARTDGLETEARVVHGRTDGDGAVYGFEFVPSPGLDAGLSRFFVRFLNRNLSQAVGALPHDEIWIHVRTEQDGFESTIVGISDEAVDVLCDGTELHRIAGSERIDLSFELPDSETVVAGPAQLRGCSIRDNGWLVSFAFDLEAPRGFSQHSGLIAGYVLRRGEMRDPAAG